MTDPDVEAFTVLYRHYVPVVHARMYDRTASRHVAEDITAATFERAYRELCDWLFSIADSIADEHERRQRPDE